MIRLTAVVLGSLLGACVALMKYLADPYNQLPAITFWLLGSLASVNPDDLRLAAPLMIAGLIPLWLLRWRINVLALDDEEARALGVATGRIRLAVIVCATLMTSAAVAIAGVVGWIGLVIPHFARLLSGPDFSRLLPLSLLGFMQYLAPSMQLATAVLLFGEPFGTRHGLAFLCIWVGLGIFASAAFRPGPTKAAAERSTQPHDAPRTPDTAEPSPPRSAA